MSKTRIDLYGSWEEIQELIELTRDSKLSRLKTVLYLMKQAKGIPQSMKRDDTFNLSTEIVRETAHKIFLFSNSWRTLNEMVIKNVTVGKIIIYLKTVKENYWEYGDKEDRILLNQFIIKKSKFVDGAYPFLSEYMKELKVVFDSKVSLNNPLRYNRKDIVEWHPYQIKEIYDDLMGHQKKRNRDSNFFGHVDMI